MTIREGDFILLRYTGRFDDTVFDTTDEETARDEDIHNPEAHYGPIVIRVGSGHVIPGLDEALVGREKGEEGEVEVPPEKGFGERDEDLIESISITRFKDKPKPGMRVKTDEREGVVVGVIGRRAKVDFNPPLAGETLHYTFTIDGVVEDPAEQIQGLIRLYTGRNDVDVTISDGTAELLLPPGIVFDRRWLLWRSRVVHEIFEYIEGIDEVVFRETFRRPAPAGEVTETESGEAVSGEEPPEPEDESSTEE
ncbi:MAG: FKBP-type peptidyl-prolyl cis-trans isomerase [Methanomicrobiales archaeon]